MGTIIDVKGLTRDFRKKCPSPSAIRGFFFPRYESFHAVDDLTIEIKQGEIFGLMGLNGAGKTTTIKLLTGLLTPTKGTIHIDGIDITHQRAICEKIGVMLGTSMIYHRMTGHANLKYYAKIYRVPDYEKRIHELSVFLGLKNWLSTYVEHYSQGMKCKLALARALIHDPPILFLDEPTIGLDVKIAMEIRKKIKNMNKTIILTTHYLEEAEELCDRIGIIHNGKLIKVDTANNLKKLVEKHPTIVVEIPDANTKIVKDLKKSSFVKNITVCDPHIEIQLKSKKEIQAVLHVLSKYNVTHIKTIVPTLTDVLVQLTRETK